MLEQIKKEYSPKEKMPLEWYGALTVAFNGLLVLALRDALREDREQTELTPTELVYLGLAAHKLSRLITKDAVTSFARAPFTRYQEPLGYGELQEKERGQGIMLVLSELLSCTYCMSAWAALGLFWGHARYPKPTALITRLFSAIAVSDFLHVLYEEKRTRSNVLTLREEKLDQGGKSSAA